MAARWRQLKAVLPLLCLWVSCFSGVKPSRTKEKIYIDLATSNGCFRLLNGTHQIGCSSELNGNTGVVYYLQTDDDWDVVLKKGTTSPYVPVLDSSNFTTANVRRLVRSGRVNGIAVISVNLTTSLLPSGFSPDKSCPNDAYGYYHGKDQGDCKVVTWNQAGDGLLFDDLDIPIFSLKTASDVETIIKKCWEPFNKPINGVARTYPLCAIQLQSAMTAVKNAETCIRRSNLITNLNPFIFCDPLGDQNVVTTLKAFPSNQTRPEKSVIVVATRMDSMSMFFNEYPSSDSTVTGIVTLLATAKALWNLQETIESQAGAKDIMFTFLQGEAFDYIGSSRMLYEMQKGRFPAELKDDGTVNLQKIDVSHIHQFVELSQVGLREDGNSLWLHTDPDVRRKTNVTDLLNMLTRFGNQSGTVFGKSDAANPLPPASVQRFLMEAGESLLPSFVITDHKTSFTNKYYNSRLDLPGPIGADYPDGLNATQEYNSNTTQSERIRDLATALARYLFWASTSTEPNATQADMLRADIEDVNHMLYCFLHSPHCELFNYTISPDSADALNKNKQPFPFYVTISVSTNQVTSLVQRVLAYFTGKAVANATEDSCSAPDKDKRYSYLWMHGAMTAPGGERKPVCYKSTVLLSKAESPAFDIDDYDWKSGKYSTWTESRWDLFKVRVFLIPSKRAEVLTLTVGIGFLLVSLVAVYFINSSADVLFQNATPEAST